MTKNKWALLSASLLLVLCSQVSAQSWMSSPPVVEIRQIYNTTNSLADNGQLVNKKYACAPSAGSQWYSDGVDVETWSTPSGKMLSFYLSTHVGHFAVMHKVYLDRNSSPRFIFTNFNYEGPADTDIYVEREFRTYLRPTGTVLFHDARLISGRSPVTMELTQILEEALTLPAQIIAQGSCRPVKRFD